MPVPIHSAIDQLFQTAGIKVVSSTELYPALHQVGEAGLPMLVIENRLGRAVVALHGAHLMSFQPAGEREMLWVSPQSQLEAGKPIRGGVPLCLPWFGPGPDAALPHGFSRVNPWTLVASEICPDGATRIVLELAGDATFCAGWPHAFSFRLEVIVGSKLQLSLRAENRGETAAPLAFAFHTYFAVPNVAEAHVAGLEGTTYIDKMDNMARKVQQGEVVISDVTDRIYLDVPATQTLLTAAGKVTIQADSKDAVVWNCWSNDQKIADIGAGNHVGYICVERCDVADHAVSLAAGDTYEMSMTLGY
jgi:D-hexose-6-phosphate mutarotase